MKFFNLLLLTLFMSGFALAAPPEKHRADRYKDLYLNSPITDAPPAPEGPEEIPPDLPDWVLVGVTKYIGRTKVQIMNIKDRSRVTIPSKEATELGFSIKKVIQDRNYLDHTVVTLQKGKHTGEVRFDPKFLVLKKVSAPSPGNNRRAGGSTVTQKGRTSNQPPTPPGVRTNSSRSSSNPPRPGTIPKPSSSRSSSTSTTTSGSTSTGARPSTTSTPTKRTRYVPRPKK